MKLHLLIASLLLSVATFAQSGFKALTSTNYLQITATAHQRIAKPITVVYNSRFCKLSLSGRNFYMAVQYKRDTTRDGDIVEHLYNKLTDSIRAGTYTITIDHNTDGTNALTVEERINEVKRTYFAPGTDVPATPIPTGAPAGTKDDGTGMTYLSAASYEKPGYQNGHIAKPISLAYNDKYARLTMDDKAILMDITNLHRSDTLDGNILETFINPQSKKNQDKYDMTIYRKKSGKSIGTLEVWDYNSQTRTTYQIPKMEASTKPAPFTDDDLKTLQEKNWFDRKPEFAADLKREDDINDGPIANEPVRSSHSPRLAANNPATGTPVPGGPFKAYIAYTYETAYVPKGPVRDGDNPNSAWYGYHNPYDEKNQEYSAHPVRNIVLKPIIIIYNDSFCRLTMEGHVLYLPLKTNAEHTKLSDGSGWDGYWNRGTDKIGSGYYYFNIKHSEKGTLTFSVRTGVTTDIVNFDANKIQAYPETETTAGGQKIQNWSQAEMQQWQQAEPVINDIYKKQPHKSWLEQMMGK